MGDAAGIELALKLIVDLIGAHVLRHRGRRPAAVRVDEDAIVMCLQIRITRALVLPECQTIVAAGRRAEIAERTPPLVASRIQSTTDLRDT